MSKLSRRGLLGTAALTIAGCTRKRSLDDRTLPQGTESSQAVLRYPLQIEPTSFDPPLITEIYSSEMMGNVFEGLCQIDAHNQPVPCLAESWSVSSDHCTYTFKLRKGVRFHNGRELQAKDVVFSFERALKPETRSPVALGYYQGILGAGELATGKAKSLNGVRAVDSYTVEVKLDQPRPYLLGMLSYGTASIVCREACEKLGGRIDHTNAVGTGPYKLTEYQPRRRCILVANDNYWGKNATVRRIERDIILDENTAHIQFEEGRLDMAIITFADYKRDQANPLLKPATRILKRAQTTYIAFQQARQPVFRDPRVRQAFAHVIPRDDVQRFAFEGVAAKAEGFLPEGMLGYRTDLKGLGFDPKKAAQLISAAGFTGGSGFPPITLEFLDKEPQWSSAAQIIRDSLKTHLGVTIDLRQREAGTYFADTHESRVPFFLAGWTADYIDPQNFLSTLFHSKSRLNRFNYSNPQFDALCDIGDTSMNSGVRENAYAKADRLMLEEAGCIPLVHNVRCALVGTHVSGFRDNLLNHLPMNEVALQKRS